MRVSWKSTRTRLQQLLSSSHKHELDHRSVRTFTDVQGKSGDLWFMATKRKQRTRNRDNGITARVRQIHKQRPLRD
jgi:hypothetical protein